MDYCGAKKRNGDSCHSPAGWGTPYDVGPCKFHGGAMPNVQKASAGKALQREALKMGVSIDIRPEDLMLTTVRQAAGALQFAVEYASKQEDASPIQNGRPSPAVLLHGEAM